MEDKYFSLAFNETFNGMVSTHRKLWFINFPSYTWSNLHFLNQIGTSTGVIEDTETEVGKYVARVDLGRFLSWKLPGSALRIKQSINLKSLLRFDCSTKWFVTKRFDKQNDSYIFHEWYAFLCLIRRWNLSPKSHIKEWSLVFHLVFLAFIYHQINRTERTTFLAKVLIYILWKSLHTLEIFHSKRLWKFN